MKSAHHLATDPLTGLYSRASLADRLAEEVDRARRYGGGFSLLLIDLDHFKSVNDAFGHRRGDRVLVELAERLAGELRTSDLLFRYGGDEFVLLLPGTARPEAATLAERLLRAVADTPFAGEPPLSATLSIGVASFPADADGAEQLFERADLRLFAAKRLGRGRVADADGPGIPAELSAATRLVERESALAEARRFLDAAVREGRAALAITGPAGAGRSRLLAAVAEHARALDFVVVPVTGTQGGRPYGALASIAREVPGLPPPGAGHDRFAGAVAAALQARGRARLLVAVDDAGTVDRASREALRALLGTDGPPVCALALAGDARAAGDGYGVAPLHTVQLEGLSPAGLRVWLRAVLQWEPPRELVDWLHARTGGLPGAAHRTLVRLAERGLLARRDGGWTLDSGYVHLDAGAPEPPPAPPHNLPAAAAAFVGREREIGEIRRLLAEHRLLTVTGPGGIGKTRLAVEAAGELLAGFSGGAWLVPLAPVASAEFVASTICEALRVPLSAAAEPRTELLRHLRERELLLVLDNFEHLPAAAALVAEILAECPDVRVLVTSRERLHLSAEAVFELGGMSVPAADEPEGIESHEAVRLFVQSARRVAPGFRLSAEELREAARVCRMADGMPLPIELAAAWVRVLSVREIAAELERGLDLLAGSARDLPPRHRSLRAAFDHSWGLLDEDERAAFRRLSVFRGGCTRAAAEEVAEASLRLLASLVDKSLLRHEARAGGESRFSMLEPVREYAAGRLAEHGEGDELRARHARHFLQLAEAAEPHFRGPEQRAWLERLEADHENVRAALRGALEAGDGETAARLAGRLWRFWEIRGYVTEGRGWLERVLELRDRIPPAALGRVLYATGALAWQQGDYGRAEEALLPGLELHRTLDDRNGVANVLNTLGNIALLRSEQERAREYYEESLALQRGLGNAAAVASTLNNLGALASDAADYGRARTLLEEALSLAQRDGDRRLVAISLLNLALAELRGGRPERTLQLAEESLAGFRELGDARGTAFSLNYLGMAAAALGETARAAELLAQALAQHHALGDRLGVTDCLEELAGVALARGDAVRAAKLLGAAGGLRAALGAPVTAANRAALLRRTEAGALQALGADALAAGMAEGSALGIDEAVALAMRG
ncbi:MAG TPA: diguanylate cyclase [Longimicrobium sp.]|nr:diguanylate cyclase [Longimicrobium sp.]